MAHQTVSDEQYLFQPGTKKNIFILLACGIALLALGLFMAMRAEGGHEAGEGHHASVSAAQQQLVASAEHGAAAEGHAEAGEHHETPTWLKRLYTTLWMNNVFFIGLGLIGLFFVAIQFAAQAGWSAGILRIPISMGSWIPIAGILTLLLWFITKHDVFHWTHEYLYDEHSPKFDEIIKHKAPFFFWPLAGGTFPLFYVLRMVLFFSVWYMFFIWIRKEMLAEDLDGDVKHWYKSQVLSTVFLIFFGVSSSIAAWDWVMSIDTHWFSTMFGWYVFASWWVTALAMITLIVATLKGAGYLKAVNSNHLHDLGKFVFAFSIFWTYIWFAQFLLIYYANIPEETVYFIERLKTGPYAWIFYTNLILNFVLPFLLFMTRDAKRQISMLKVVCPIVIVGHWFDFYNMITPGVMKLEGGIGFMEIGVALIFLSVYLFVVLSSLSKIPLLGKKSSNVPGKSSPPHLIIKSNMMSLIIGLGVILIFVILFLIYRVGTLVGIAKGKDPDKIGLSNKVNAALFIVFMVGSFALFFWYSFAFFKEYTLPVASVHGKVTDMLFWITMAITVAAFTIISVIMFVFIYKYQYKEGYKAKYYPDNHYLELAWTIIPAIVLAVLIFTGLRAWNDITGPASKEAEVIEMIGQQFAWTVRYPGKDKELGKVNFKLIDNVGNEFGLDLSDKNSFDDFKSLELHLPVNKEILLKIRAKDVLHSVFLPHFRVKMDAVPGMPTQFKFVATLTTQEMRDKLGNPNFNYELACTEICGKGHFSMKMPVVVDDEETYAKWKASQEAWLKQNPDYLNKVPAELKEAAKVIAGIQSETPAVETVAAVAGSN